MILLKNLRKLIKKLIIFGNLSLLFLWTNYSDPGKKLEDTCGFPENITVLDMGHN